MDFLEVPWGNSGLVFLLENGLGFSLQAAGFQEGASTGESRASDA